MVKTVLTLNVGSSSVKYKLFVDEKEEQGGYFERILTKEKRVTVVEDIIKKLNGHKLDAIAHRVVHGGTINETKRITTHVVREIEKVAPLAPLHNYPQLDVIKSFLKLLKKTPQFAVFDTAFHQTMPMKAKLYGLPYELYKKQGIQRFGFHGTSHKFVSRKLRGKVITCHLGSGCSITAIKDGKSVDTSMGFTPLEGLMMGTRAGSFDPAIILYLLQQKIVSLQDLDDLLNKKSGLLGISGFSNDMRDVLKMMRKGSGERKKRATLAVEMFVYRVVKQIGAYVAAMNGVDTLIFTAGITERNWHVRKMITDSLTYLGVKVDDRKNKKNASVISSSGSKVKVMVIPTNEELEMAQEARELLR